MYPQGKSALTARNGASHTCSLSLNTRDGNDLVDSLDSATNSTRGGAFNTALDTSNAEAAHTKASCNIRGLCSIQHVSR